MKRWQWRRLGTGLWMIVLVGLAWSMWTYRLDALGMLGAALPECFDESASPATAEPYETFEQGIRRQYDGAGRLLREFQVDAAGNLHGDLREFYSTGTVRYQMAHVDGRRMGLEKFYRTDGGLSRIAWIDANGRERAAASFLADGQLSNLQCGHRPLLEELDRQWCGFAGQPSEVVLHGEHGPVRQESWLLGELQRRDELDEWGRLRSSFRLINDEQLTVRYFPNGQLKAESTFRGRGRNQAEGLREGREREWAENGQLVQETVWKQGHITHSTQWYPNGELKERRFVKPGTEATSQPVLRVEHYWENGKLSYRGAQRGGVGVGSHKRFDEQGRLRLEIRLDPNGTPLLRIEYDPQTGAVLQSEHLQPKQGGTSDTAAPHGRGYF